MKNDQKHIVFLTPGFAKSEDDSTNITALQIFLKALRQALTNTEMTIITFQYPHKTEPYNWFGINVIPLNGKSKRSRKLWTWQKANKHLKKLHKKLPINAIHSFWIGECSMIGERFSKKNNIIHIVTAMGQDARYKTRYTNLVLNGNAKVISLSRNHLTDLQNKLGIDSEIISWFINYSDFTEIKATTIDILGVGSLTDVKNYDEFLEIISELHKTHNHLKVEIIGKGHLKKHIISKIEQLGLQKVVKLQNETPRIVVYKKMATSKILLHTSTYESFGMVFLEALYAGMHIVSYNVGCAESSNKWHIGTNKSELLSYCNNLLKQKSGIRTRQQINEKSETLNAYIKLYNA